MEKIDIHDYYSVAPEFIDELYFLQVELVKLQKYISDKKLRMAILFEGRDTAGKGSGVERFTQFLNPRSYDVVALSKPTKEEQGQWYFQRYIKRLPNPGEMVFFDRSWYNRAVVEPVMGFCTDKQYRQFMEQVIQFEKMIIEDGIIVVKLWFTIDSEEQQYRIRKRLTSPLEQWKISPVDLAANKKWEAYTKYKREMFNKTGTVLSPWIDINGDRRERRRIEAMKYVLSILDYKNKSPDFQPPSDDAVVKWDRVGQRFLVESLLENL